MSALSAMMIVGLPRPVRQKKSRKLQSREAQSVAGILRAAYRRHTRSRLTLAAVKRCLG
jgi:hypothetical protein